MELVPGDTLATVAHALVAPPEHGVHGLLLCHVGEPDVDSHEQVQLHLALVLLPCLGEELPAARSLGGGLDDTFDGIISQLGGTAIDLAHVSHGAVELSVVAGEAWDASNLQDSTSLAVKEGHEEVATLFPEALLSCFSSRERSGKGLVLLPKENRAALFFPHCLGDVAPPVGGSERGGGDRSDGDRSERGGHEVRGGVVGEEVQAVANNDDRLVLELREDKPIPGMDGWKASPPNGDFFPPPLHGGDRSGGLLPLREEWSPITASGRPVEAGADLEDLLHVWSLGRLGIRSLLKLFLEVEDLPRVKPRGLAVTLLRREVVLPHADHQGP